MDQTIDRDSIAMAIVSQLHLQVIFHTTLEMQTNKILRQVVLMTIPEVEQHFNKKNSMLMKQVHDEELNF